MRSDEISAGHWNEGVQEGAGDGQEHNHLFTLIEFQNNAINVKHMKKRCSDVVFRRQGLEQKGVVEGKQKKRESEKKSRQRASMLEIQRTAVGLTRDMQDCWQQTEIREDRGIETNGIEGSAG